MDNQILEVFSKDTGEYIYRAINEDGKPYTNYFKFQYFI